MSYLDSYGVRDAQQERKLRYVIAGLLLPAATAVFLFFWLRDRSEKQQVERFLSALRSSDYKHAYEFWGCSYEKPCREYPFSKFLEDWGQVSPQANASAARLAGGQHCTSGRIQVVRFPNHEIQLWIERKTQLIGFAPWPIDTSPPSGFTSRLRRMMHDLAGDCAPPPMKVP